MNTTAATWFVDVYEFRQLCGDAQSLARDESSQEFAAEMMLAANRYGLDTYISPPQMRWLCRIADWELPKRRDDAAAVG